MSGRSARIRRAARRPSSVCVGGMRMSVTATSGRCSATAASSESKSPASADDLDPGGLEHARDALAQQQRVLGDHDPHGITPRTRVPPPGGLVDRRACRRAPRAGRPSRAGPSRRPGRRRRAPSSAISIVSVAPNAHADVGAGRVARSGRRSSAPRRRGSTRRPRPARAQRASRVVVEPDRQRRAAHERAQRGHRARARSAPPGGSRARARAARRWRAAAPRARAPSRAAGSPAASRPAAA